MPKVCRRPLYDPCMTYGPLCDPPVTATVSCSQSECNSLEGVDAKYEFSRLRQSMEMVGFSPDKQSKLFALLSAVLLIGKGRRTLRHTGILEQYVGHVTRERI